MSIFKEEIETKRVIFNIEVDLANRLDDLKKNARTIGKRLDADTAVNRALEKFLKKAEKKIYEIMKKKGIADPLVITSEETDDHEPSAAGSDGADDVEDE
ncbi:hypothetical protein [Desulfococcus sp.]|uniref:hypothetical protein n=1 Tax=Desulfococcus sp. TaxID=2025834 RepID=UPI0035930250